MKFKELIYFLTCYILCGFQTFAQKKFSSPVSIDRQMKDTFSFPKQWDYLWEVFKDDSTGEFSRISDQKLMPDDTTHLFFTSNCQTNVQGGYNIRYCFADKNKDVITLTFSDGLPAYANEFIAYIKGENFYFEPKTIYPVYIPGEKISYQMTKQKLTLNKNNYSVNDTIIGYIDTEFIEIVSVPKKGVQKHKFYFRGFFKTLINRRNTASD